MLAKRFRLTSPRLGRDKRTVKTGHLFFYFVRTDFSFSRFAVLVPKSVFRSAVRRNALRRTVYEVLRIEKLYRFPGYDVAIRCFDGNLSSSDIEREIVFFRNKILT